MKFSDLKVGMKVRVTGNICIEPEEVLEVYKNGYGEFCVECCQGDHGLDAEEDGFFGDVEDDNMSNVELVEDV